MVTDDLLHGAFESLVGGGDGQDEVLGSWFPLREEPLILPRGPGCGDCGVQEGNGRRREEAGRGEFFRSCDKAEEILQRDGAPPH